MRQVSPRVAWISFTPVKGLRLRQLEEAEVTSDGIPGDRAFFVVDRDGTMLNGKRLGSLQAVVAEHDAAVGRLSLRFPDGRELSEPVELGEPTEVRFHSRTLRARPLCGGDLSAALSDHAGVPLRLFAAPAERPGVDRGHDGAVSLLSTGSLERLREQAGATEPVDMRRFRMTFGVEGVAPHAEDGWREVRVGETLLRVRGNVGRCAVTTRHADSGEVDFQTLHHLAAYRRDGIETTEPLPFGVHARVLEPGRVRVGDAVEPLG